MMLTAMRIGVLATILSPLAPAQPAPPHPARPAIPADGSCGQALPSSTFITANAVIEVKDIPLCFDPAYIEITHVGGTAAYGHLAVIVDASPSVRGSTTLFQSTNTAPLQILAAPASANASGWNVSTVTVNFDGAWTAATQFALPLTIGRGSGPYALSVVNPPENLSSTFSLAHATTILGFTDITGRPLLIPADPSLPVINGDWNGDGREGPVDLLLHADQLGAYAAALTVSGRRLRAIIMRSRKSGVLGDSLSPHHHIQIQGKAGERADIDLDEVGIRPPALCAGSSTEPAVPLPGRRSLQDAPSPDGRATVPALPAGRRGELTPATRSAEVSGILPLRI